MFGLPENTLFLMKNYFKKNPDILKVYLFGSRAMGKEQPGSDIDLAIISTSPSDLSLRIQLDLNELSTPYLFDVVDYRYITHQPLRDHIDRVGKLLFEKNLEDNTPLR